jgi:aspartate kinase
MNCVVQKYGGTSVADSERLRAVAVRVSQTVAAGQRVAVVVSAMGKRTDELVAMAQALDSQPPPREMDMLLSTGEMVSAPLLAMALHSMGVAARSLTGLQAGITTSSSHSKARIRAVNPDRVIAALDEGVVPIVAGFQGVTEELDVTTLGRGGSDTTAVALAVALDAQRCDIFTDVNGVYSADPRVVENARLLPTVTYEEMLELAAVGANVLHPRAVEIGEAHDMPISVRSSFADVPGTTIARASEGSGVEERQTVRGIASDHNVAKLTVTGVPDHPGIAARLFTPLAQHQINVDLIFQNVSHDGTTDVSFTVAKTDLGEARSLLDQVISEIGARDVSASDGVAKVSLVGTGIRNTPGVFATAFNTLADAGINIDMISSGEIHLTCIVDADRADDAVRALHTAFQLDRL